MDREAGLRFLRTVSFNVGDPRSKSLGIISQGPAGRPKVIGIIVFKEHRVSVA